MAGRNVDLGTVIDAISRWPESDKPQYTFRGIQGAAKGQWISMPQTFSLKENLASLHPIKFHQKDTDQRPNDQGNYDRGMYDSRHYDQEPLDNG